ncbi:MAG: ADOP family duplicated permease, partial [Acidobacteriota bacterium]
MDFRLRFPSRIWRPDVENEVDDELGFHLEMRTREYVGRGMTPTEARREAFEKFGDYRRTRRECRSIGRQRERRMRMLEYLSELRQDGLFALRQMWAAPAFTATALVTLAVGIGATTAIFSAVNAVVLRPLPMREPGRLVYVAEVSRGLLADVSAGNYVDTTARQRSFDQLAAINYTSFNISEDGAPERLVGARVTASFFAVLGVPPAAGRVFSQAEDQPGHERVVVLSHRLWQRRFGANPALVGRDIRLNGQPYSVVGVMPASFDLTSDSEELWVPIAFTPERRATHDEHYLTVVGRLKSGTSVEQANADLHSIALGLRKAFPKDDAELDIRAVPFAQLFVGDYRERLLLLLGAVGLVLLIACGNVATLLLARGASRLREIALRNALGAGQARLIRQLITESLVLATLAAAAGTVLAFWLVRGLVEWFPPGVPRLEQARVDGVALVFAVGMAVLSSLLFGSVPAWRASRMDVSNTLKDGGRSPGGRAARDWVRSTLIGGEVALSVVLLVGAGLLIRSSMEMHRMNPGFDPNGVIAARLSLPPDAYAEPARATEAFRQIAENTRRIPGVTAAAVVSQPPLSPGGNGNGLLPEGKAFDIRNMTLARLRIVTPGYFGAIGTPIVQGRAFDDHDVPGGQKVMI